MKGPANRRAFFVSPRLNRNASASDVRRQSHTRGEAAGLPAHLGGGRAPPPTQALISDATPDPIVPGARYAHRLGAYPIDLREEEARGGHTIEKHVSRSPQALVAQVRDELVERPDARDVRSGSFSS